MERVSIPFFCLWCRDRRLMILSIKPHPPNPQYGFTPPHPKHPRLTHPLVFKPAGVGQSERDDAVIVIPAGGVIGDRAVGR